MPRCKHYSLIDSMICGRLPKDKEDYFCSQCHRWITGIYIREQAKIRGDEYLAIRDE
jgi:hypothetical protein